MKLQLPDVTLVLASTVCHELCEMSLNTCTSLVDFGEVVVASDIFLTLDHQYRYFNADLPDVEAYCDWLLHELPPKLRTSHFLVVQWDSWIINADAWRHEFLDYDYIGAPWQHRLVNDYPEVAVGNGGFSLRTTRLARRVANLKPRPRLVPEDHHICYTLRNELEAEGFRFAPVNLAADFAFETIAPPRGAIQMPFGFHGAFNWWRVLSDEDMNKRLRLMPRRMRELREPQLSLLAADAIMHGRKIDGDAIYRP